MGDATRIVAVLAIMTLACAGQCAIPGTEDFETAIVPATAPGSCSAAGGLPAGWTNDPAASNTWTPWSGSTPSSGVGPAGDHTTGNGIYLYCEGSGCNNYTAILNAPCVDMSAVVAPPGPEPMTRTSQSSVSLIRDLPRLLLHGSTR